MFYSLMCSLFSAVYLIPEEGSVAKNIWGNKHRTGAELCDLFFMYVNVHTHAVETPMGQRQVFQTKSQTGAV